MTSLEMPSVDWTAGLKRSGLYLEGIVEASSLNNVLEAHKRDTVSCALHLSDLILLGVTWLAFASLAIFIFMQLNLSMKCNTPVAVMSSDVSTHFKHCCRLP